MQKTDEVQKVTILQTAEDSENTIRSVEASLLEVLPDEIALDRKIIEGSDTFSIEENIQDFILSEDAPDVLICMSTVAAICAYHIVV